MSQLSETDIVRVVHICSAYKVLRHEREEAWATDRLRQRSHRTGPIRYTYPPDLSTFPQFAEWLDHHV
jgi:hypothetical protein